MSLLAITLYEYTGYNTGDILCFFKQLKVITKKSQEARLKLAKNNQPNNNNHN